MKKIILMVVLALVAIVQTAYSWHESNKETAEIVANSAVEKYYRPAPAEEDKYLRDYTRQFCEAANRKGVDQLLQQCRKIESEDRASIQIALQQLSEHPERVNVTRTLRRQGANPNWLVEVASGSRTWHILYGAGRTNLELLSVY